MNEYLNTIKDYLKLRESFCDTDKYIGFLTCNGKRLILRPDHSSSLSDPHIVISSELKIVKLDDNTDTDSVMGIILGYLNDENSIEIEDIFIFNSLRLAIGWLLKDNKDSIKEKSGFPDLY